LPWGSFRTSQKKAEESPKIEGPVLLWPKGCRILPRPLIKRDRFLSNDTINVVGDDGQSALANRAIDRDVRINDFRPTAVLDHLVTLLIVGDRLESERFPDRSANLAVISP
jgi:hypothetical protein